MTHFFTKLLCGGVVTLSLIIVVVIALDPSQKTNENSTLQLVAILHRHGFRTPKRTYKNDPYQEDAWPVAWGQLLNKGKQQLYKLGKTFQRRYKPFITKYSSKSVYVRTSDYDRCHMSVASLLAAWFPPIDEDEKWNEELAWQPIPIHTVPRHEDNMLAQGRPCQRYDLEKNRIDKEIKANETEEDKKFYKNITEKMGEEINNPEIINTLYTTLLIEETQGFKLPDWTKSVYPELMNEKAKLSSEAYIWNKLMRRLSTGPFINELLGQFVKKQEGKNNDLKLLIYSAHDSTILSVWRTLEFDGILQSDFGASMTFELHKSSRDEYFVKMFYLNNTELTEPHELQIPNCSSPCTLDMLYNITEDVRPEDWEKECAITLVKH